MCPRADFIIVFIALELVLFSFALNKIRLIIPILCLSYEEVRGLEKEKSKIVCSIYKQEVSIRNSLIFFIYLSISSCIYTLA